MTIFPKFRLLSKPVPKKGKRPISENVTRVTVHTYFEDMTKLRENDSLQKHNIAFREEDADLDELCLFQET